MSGVLNPGGELHIGEVVLRGDLVHGFVERKLGRLTDLPTLPRDSATGSVLA
jgi:hypothetical protein